MTQGQPEALRIADQLAQVVEMECVYPAEAKRIERVIRGQHASIAELEAELAALRATPPAQSQSQSQSQSEILGWVTRRNGKLGGYFYTYEPHADCVVRDEGGEKVALVAAPQAQDVQRDNEWEEIHSLPVCDDLIWLYCQDTNTIDGPVAPSPSFVDSWSHWAYATAPSTTVIDAAIAASAKGGEA